MPLFQSVDTGLAHLLQQTPKKVGGASRALFPKCLNFKSNLKMERGAKDILPLQQQPAGLLGGWKRAVETNHRSHAHTDPHTHTHICISLTFLSSLISCECDKATRFRKTEKERERERGVGSERERGVRGGWERHRGDCWGRRRVFGVTVACRRLRNVISLRVRQERE